MQDRQRTIESIVELRGPSLFSGAEAILRLRPAEPNTGVVFVRTDIEGRPRVPASTDFVTHHMRRTSLKNGEAEIECVEHFMAALAGLRIDNVEAEVSGKELPVGDGSAKAFVDLVRDAGIVEQDEPKRPFTVRDAISVTENDASVVALPNPRGLALSYTLEYENLPFDTQFFSLTVTEEDFVEQLAPARTFCLRSEVEKYRPYVKGANTDNTVVIEDDGTFRCPLRFPDECVRHKTLDLLGDLYLATAPIAGRVVAVKSGHTLNARLATRIAEAMQEDEVAGLIATETTLGVEEIRRLLPHRYPFLLVDRVIELRDGQHAVGIKNVTVNEEFFQGHWPQTPIMPGVLQIEAMAQLAGILLLHQLENVGKLTMLLSIDNAKLRRPVVPGDQLRLEADVVRVKSRAAEVRTKALVHGRVAAEAQMRFAFVDAEGA